MLRIGSKKVGLIHRSLIPDATKLSDLLKHPEFIQNVQKFPK